MAHDGDAQGLKSNRRAIRGTIIDDDNGDLNTGRAHFFLEIAYDPPETIPGIEGWDHESTVLHESAFSAKTAHFATYLRRGPICL